MRRRLALGPAGQDAGEALGVQGQVRDDVATGPVGQPARGGEGLVVEAVDRADQPLGRLREQLELGLGVEVVHGPSCRSVTPVGHPGEREDCRSPDIGWRTWQISSSSEALASTTSRTSPSTCPATP